MAKNKEEKLDILRNIQQETEIHTLLEELLPEMGFQHVYVTHERGNKSEDGKDVICSKHDDIENTDEWYAFVVKKGAISGQTAAELIYNSADANKPHMGLTTWRHAPNGKILKSDVSVAKNYLSQKDLNALNRLVSAYLDLAEDRAEREIPTTMQEWATVLDDFLSLARYPLLLDAGKVSALEAKLKAESEYEVFRKVQDQNYISDFDEEVKRLQGK